MTDLRQAVLAQQAKPVERKPLTDEEIKAYEQQAMADGALPHEQRLLFARAIEKAHGIE